MYLTKPKLDFERVSRINSLIDVPMVMHGGSGVSEADYKEVIARGIRKINYYTYMSKAAGEAISGKKYTQYHDAIKDAVSAMKADVSGAIKIFSGLK
jgi:fructose-bisphosphate aldolase class II